MRLALFDLDHTLIPFDSGMAWTRFLVELGVLPADSEGSYLAQCRQYVTGTLDIRALHRATVLPLARYSSAALAQWAAEFERRMASQVLPAARAQVQTHLDAGDLCAMVTATTRFIAEPFARLFGIAHLLATEPATAHGVLTGEIEGEPCYREHKVSHVDAWLARQGLSRAGFEASWFYSDSVNDLALLSAVSNPVVVRPDDLLRAHAQQAGWPIRHFD